MDSQNAASEKPDDGPKKRTPSDLAKAVSEISKKNVGAALYRDQWTSAIQTYCKENNITPAQLIEQHSYWATTSLELFGEYDAEKRAAIKEAIKKAANK